jgi:hypothetical protein
MATGSEGSETFEVIGFDVDVAHLVADDGPAVA